jgi:hypothetical protein
LEVFDLVKSIDALVANTEPIGHEQVVIPNPTRVGEKKFNLKKFYAKPPQVAPDNHFSGDKVMDLLGRKGYGATMTTCRDCFPEGLKD